MAHYITEVDSIVSTGERPWHGLGFEVKEHMTTAEAISKAELDWKVFKVPIITEPGCIPELRYGLQVPDHFATVRADTREVLGVVGPQYCVFQNQQMFDFIDVLLREKLPVVEVCGSLKRGRVVWALLKLPGHITVNKTDDVSAKYLLVTNSHDGSTTFRALFTVIRVVCWNTISAALSRGARQGVSIRHTPNLDANIDEARRILGIANERYSEISEVIDRLAHCQPRQKQVDELIDGLFPFRKHDDDTQNDVWREIVVAQRERVRDLFETGKGQNLKGVKGTAWALVNAVTEYVDWREPPRLKGCKVGEGRLYSAWFGTGAALKEKAFDAAMSMARIRPGRN